MTGKALDRSPVSSLFFKSRIASAERINGDNSHTENIPTRVTETIKVTAIITSDG